MNNNPNNPSLTQNYSILQWADALRSTNMPASSNVTPPPTFEYMIIIGAQNPATAFGYIYRNIPASYSAQSSTPQPFSPGVGMAKMPYDQRKVRLPPLPELQMMTIPPYGLQFYPNLPWFPVNSPNSCLMSISPSLVPVMVSAMTTHSQPDISIWIR